MSKTKVSLNGIIKDIKKSKSKKYDLGGYVDCPDQEKDPVTGKCKAEEVRSKEQASANKAASADLNAWAKQVAAMDRANSKQDAAQYAGQTSFDYDWMQSLVEKAEKKAAIAQYKQFFQQNPNTFVPDDTSGFSPEQKYIIASKLKQKASTNLGAKAFQQKFNQDPRFYDLQRIQSDIVPTMGGWSGVRNWMFNNKAYGGPIVDPRGQWAHPGQITQIPSNEITMEGVPYDVIGISDEGDVKKMKPGKNYKFKGNKVTEFPMMQKGGTNKLGIKMPVATLTSYPEQPSNLSISTGVESGTSRPTSKVVTQADIKRQQEAARVKEEQDRKEAFAEAARKQRENQSYLSQDNRTYGERENDRLRLLEAKRQEAMGNSQLAQTFGSFTPSGYNPGAGAVAANQFVKTMPLIATGSLAAAEVLPYLGAAMNAPIAGVTGLTANNVMNAGFAYQGAKNIPNVASSVKKAYQKPTLGNVGNAALETGVTALDMIPFAAEVAPGVKTAINTSKESGLLSNAYKYNPFAFKSKSDAYYRMIGKKGYADALESGVIRPPVGSGHREAYYNTGYPLDARLRDQTGRAGYSGPYMAEVKGNPDAFVNENVANYTGPMFNDPVVYSKQNIPISDPGVKFYKEDWLRGYKEVPKLNTGNTRFLEGTPIEGSAGLPKLQIAPSGNYLKEDLVRKNMITQKDIDKIAQREIAWIESPEYLRRRMEATGETAEQIKAATDKYKELYGKTNFIVKDKIHRSSVAGAYQPENIPTFLEKLAGQKYEGPGVFVNSNLNREEALNAIDHELGHAFSQSATNESYKGYPTLSLTDGPLSKASKDIQYLSKEDEQQVRMQRLLKQFEDKKGIPRGQQITEQQLSDFFKEHKVGTPAGQQFQNTHSDVINLINQVAMKNPGDRNKTRKEILDALNKSYLVPGAIGVSGAAALSKQADGGEMIRRADGSYSRRGLWDNIRANKGSGKKPTKDMLEQEKKIKAKNMANGGTNNAGFEALPEYVQAKILSQMGYGGYYNPYMEEGGEPNGGMALGQIMAVADKMNKLRQFVSPEENLDPWIASKLAVMDDSAAAIADYMMYNPEAQGESGEEEMGEENEQEGEEEKMANGGYVVTRSNDRKGKTHKVTGPDGTVKYFGDSKLGQHPKDPERKKAFYARHKKNLENNPFFRAFARKTWEEGGSTFSGNAWYGNGGTNNPGFKALPDFVQHQILSNMAYGGIHINPANKGKFTESAQRAGMGVQEFASHILANKEDYSSTQVKRANFAHNAAGWNKANGGPVAGQEMDVTPEELEMLRQQGYQFEIL